MKERERAGEVAEAAWAVEAGKAVFSFFRFLGGAGGEWVEVGKMTSVRDQSMASNALVFPFSFCTASRAPTPFPLSFRQRELLTERSSRSGADRGGVESPVRPREALGNAPAPVGDRRCGSGGSAGSRRRGPLRGARAPSGTGGCGQHSAPGSHSNSIEEKVGTRKRKLSFLFFYFVMFFVFLVPLLHLRH